MLIISTSALSSAFLIYWSTGEDCSAHLMHSFGPNNSKINQFFRSRQIFPSEHRYHGVVAGWRRRHLWAELVAARRRLVTSCRTCSQSWGMSSTRSYIPALHFNTDSIQWVGRVSHTKYTIGYFFWCVHHATQEHRHLQGVVRTSRHLTLSEDKNWRSGTSFGSHHSNRNQWLVPFLLAGTAVTLCSPKTVKQRALLSRKIEKVAELWGHPLGKSGLPEPTSCVFSFHWLVMFKRARSCHQRGSLQWYGQANSQQPRNCIKHIKWRRKTYKFQKQNTTEIYRTIVFYSIFTPGSFKFKDFLPVCIWYLCNWRLHGVDLTKKDMCNVCRVSVNQFEAVQTCRNKNCPNPKDVAHFFIRK